MTVQYPFEGIGSTLLSLIDIAEEAGSTISRMKEFDINKYHKQNSDWVTSADLASHTIIETRFNELFPDLFYIMEESYIHKIQSNQFLVADELDGTVPFLAGSDDWGVMLALIDGKPMHGVIHLPDKGVTIAAEDGNGCWMNGEKMLLGGPSSLRDTILTMEVNASFLPSDWKFLKNLIEKVSAVRCLACTAASILELLTGITHIYLNRRGGKIWDFAAPAIVVQEAGGKAVDIQGQPLSWNDIDMSFMAASGSLLIDNIIRN